MCPVLFSYFFFWWRIRVYKNSCKTYLIVSKNPTRCLSFIDISYWEWSFHLQWQIPILADWHPWCQIPLTNLVRIDIATANIANCGPIRQIVFGTYQFQVRLQAAFRFSSAFTKDRTDDRLHRESDWVTPWLACGSMSFGTTR